MDTDTDTGTDTDTATDTHADMDTDTDTDANRKTVRVPCWDNFGILCNKSKNNPLIIFLIFEEYVSLKKSKKLEFPTLSWKFASG